MTKNYHFPKGYSLMDTLLRTSEFLKNPIAFVTKSMAKFGDTYTAPVGIKNKIILTQDPEFIDYVLRLNQKNYNKQGFAVERGIKYFGNGLVFSSGDYWRRQRRLIQPGFHRKKIQNLMQNVINTTQFPSIFLQRNNFQKLFH